MNADKAVKYLAQGVASRGADCLAGIVSEIAREAGHPIKTLQMHFHEPIGKDTMKLQGATWRFPRLPRLKDQD